MSSDFLHAASVSDIHRMTDSGICGVAVAAGDDQPWLDELADAVVSGRFVVPRTVLPAVTPAELAAWARSATTALPTAVAAALVDDMATIAARVAETGAVERVMVRVFTEAPTRRCGFHVDTVPALAPTVGALRVYNGPTTEYVDCGAVLGMAEFYRYLARRERLSRMLGPGARPEPDGEQIAAELTAMDDAPHFLREGAPVRRVPPGATVYFKHVDIRRHWQPHPVTDGWIHRSPMSGTARLVLNVSPAERSRPAHARSQAAHE